MARICIIIMLNAILYEVYIFFFLRGGQCSFQKQVIESCSDIVVLVLWWEFGYTITVHVHFNPFLPEVPLHLKNFIFAFRDLNFL